MGWLGNLLKAVAGAPAIDLTFAPSIPARGTNIPGIGKPIEADACYIELYLESLRLERARSFATRFHGVAYSFISLSREGEERAQLAAISKPEKLADLDKNSLGRVITVSKRMMGATAYRGGTVSLELGLFSVKSGNVMTPVLDYVTRVSSVAGINYVGAIKPFVPLLIEGMDLIAGQWKDTELEVGIDTDVTLTAGGVAAIIACPKGSIPLEKLSMDRDHSLLLDGKRLECGYAAFSFRPSAEKTDYSEIPELKERYAAMQTAIKAGKMTDAKDALAAFRFATVASADLIPSDARRLYEKAKRKFDAAFPPGGIAALESEAANEGDGLSQIGLYD